MKHAYVWVAIGATVAVIGAAVAYRSATAPPTPEFAQPPASPIAPDAAASDLAHTAPAQAPPPPSSGELRLPDGRPLPTVDTSAMVPLIVRYCGSCHKTPPADILPKRAWVEVVVPEMVANWLPTVGILLTQDQGEQLMAWYAKLAPDELDPLPYGPGASPIAFEPAAIGGRGFLTPMVSNVKIIDLYGDGQNEIIVTDTELHRVSVLERDGDVWKETTIAEIQAPVHAEVFDADGDGKLDILVAALGQLMPTDEPIGSVTLLRQVERGRFEPQTIAANIDRATDARPADVNGDGRIDYIVGMFGWRESGGIDWYEQLEDGTFERHIISEQHGAIRLETTDLNGDGLIDFVVLLAQEFEQVIAFINTGDDGYGELSARFEPHILYEGPHPMFGSSGLILADLNQNGRMDVIFTNGDAFDLDKHPKPYHGVQWLENLGGQGVPKFRYHDIGRFYGAMAAAVGDLNGDGHLDVIAVSQYNDWRDPKRQALIWFENDGRQNFTRHDLGRAATHLATVAVGDVDGDGRPDIVTGTLYAGAWEMDDDSPFRFPPPEERKRLMLWKNLGPVKE